MGNGPYILSEWVHQDHITLEANPNYWGQAPMQARIRLSMITDVNAELTAYLSGDETFFELVKSLAMPLITLVIVVSAQMIRMTRAGILNVMNSPYNGFGRVKSRP